MSLFCLIIALVVVAGPRFARDRAYIQVCFTQERHRHVHIRLITGVFLHPASNR